MILISLVIEGGSRIGSWKMSKALSDLLPSEAKMMLVLVGDSCPAAAYKRGSRKLSKKLRRRVILGFIASVE